MYRRVYMHYIIHPRGPIRVLYTYAPRALMSTPTAPVGQYILKTSYADGKFILYIRLIYNINIVFIILIIQHTVPRVRVCITRVKSPTDNKVMCLIRRQPPAERLLIKEKSQRVMGTKGGFFEVMFVEKNYTLYI